MLKNIVIALLSIVIVLFWLKEEPEDIISNNPNDVVIEYQCSTLEDYQHVPPEVIEECQTRGFSVRLKDSI